MYYVLQLINWSGVVESNHYNDFRRIMSYPLNERQKIYYTTGYDLCQHYFSAVFKVY